MAEKHIYRVFCETDSKYVETGWLDSEPTKCPEDAGHSIDLDSISAIKTGVESGNPYCYINYASDKRPYHEITKSSWKTIAKFLYVGSDLSPISSFSAIVGRSGDTGIASIRLRDMTSNNIIATMSWTSEDVQTIMDAELENIPTDSAILQIQVKLDSNSDDNSHVYSTGLGYCDCI